MADCGCSETPAPACGACEATSPVGVDAPELTPTTRPAPRTRTPPRLHRLGRSSPQSAEYGPPHKRWDGIVHSADGVLLQLREPVNCPSAPMQRVGQQEEEFPIPEITYPGPSTAVVPGTSLTCDWLFLGMAAPLLDPTGGTAAHCPVDPYLNCWLTTTSPAVLRRGRRESRMYFNDGQIFLGSDNRIDFPRTVMARTYLFDSNGAPQIDSQTGEQLYVEQSVGKFFTNRPTSTPLEVAQLWRASLETNDVRDLHFSREFISFLDSMDGLIFPVQAPIITTSNSSTPCDFIENASDPFDVVSEVFVRHGFRSGWRSTVVPCFSRDASGAIVREVVYKVDSVLEICFNRRPLYLMFAVQCQGHFDEGEQRILDEEESGCSPCTPCGTRTPRTRYVFFTCPDPDFQDGVYGPFHLQGRGDQPDPQQGQWVGVPQAFLSPDGVFLFLYLHPQSVADPGAAGLFVASMDAFTSALTRVMASFPVAIGVHGPHGPAPVPDPDPVAQNLEDLSGVALGAAFVRVAASLELCGGSDEHVDQHFMFCEGRLHLYATALRTNSQGATELDKFEHYSARVAFDASLLSRWVEASYDGTFDALRLQSGVREMASTFDFDCAPITTKRLLGSADAGDINDPTVYPLEDLYEGETGQPSAMLFYSDGLQGLAIAGTVNPCRLGDCHDDKGRGSELPGGAGRPGWRRSPDPPTLPGQPTGASL